MLKFGDRRFLTRAVIELAIFSAVTNLLLLVLPLYLLQVYDRVLTAASQSTLFYLSVFAVGALCVLGLLEIVRSHYSNRVAARIEISIGSDVFLASMNSPRAVLGDVQPLRDLATIKGFVASRALTFLFDLPFAPLFIAILYLIHPTLFWITLIGAALLCAVAALNQAGTRRSGKFAGDSLVSTMNAAQTYARNFETVRALGMVSNVVEAWGRQFGDVLQASDRVAVANAFWGGLSRTLRLILQVAIIGVGAYLVLAGEMTAGMIFAASIISGRALQPLDQIIGSWRQVIEVWRAWKRVGAAVDGLALARRSVTELPAPSGELRVEQLIYFLPDSDPGAQPLIKRMAFKVEAGETVAIIGPSQAGKSTLARLLVGAIKPRSGTIRLDNADIQNWDPDALGRHIGYLSQDVELFPGTIAQNISRFDADAADADIIEAAQNAQAHQLILGQKQGYATGIGPMGVRLSGGERQRIGLARAFYGNPKIVVLDEPNANLDAEGEQSLERAILDARSRKTTVLVITHRPSIAAKCDRVMMLRDGQIELYGPAADVLQRLAQGGQGKPAPARPGADAPSEQAMPAMAAAAGPKAN